MSAPTTDLTSADLRPGLVVENRLGVRLTIESVGSAPHSMPRILPGSGIWVARDEGGLFRPDRFLVTAEGLNGAGYRMVEP